MFLDRSATPQPLKKRRKNATKGQLSFDLNDVEDNALSPSSPAKSRTTLVQDSATSEDKTRSDHTEQSLKWSGPNTAIANAPRVLTKSAMLKEAQIRERLRKEFLAMQERVKATEVLIPFVFYDGTSAQGGRCRIKKGEHVWLFLDQSRKVGAELGIGGGDKSKRQWARVGVDDLMLVRGDLIVPHHYDFYYFLVNKVKSHNGLLFDFSPEPTAATPAQVDVDAAVPKDYNPLVRSGRRKEQSAQISDTLLEGATDDPTLTKVVDRRWYEKNKHIYPASLWTEYDPTKDYSSGIRTDTKGNAFFFT